MKTFFRILRFANPFANFAVPYFIYSILSIVFGMFTFTLLIPLLDIIFNKVTLQDNIQYPNFRLELSYLKDLFSFYFQKILVQYGRQGSLLFVCVIIISTNLLSNFFKYFSQIILIKVKAVVVFRIRNTLFEKLTQLHLSYFSNERKGDLMSKLTNDVGQVEICVVSTLQNFLRDPITIIAYFILLFSISWQMTLYSLIIFPISGIIISSISRKLKHNSGEAQRSLGRLLSIIDETLTGFRIIFAFNAKKIVANKFEEENRFFSKYYRKIMYTNDLASPLSEVMGIIVVSSILWIGGNIVLEGKSDLTASAFIAYLSVFSQILSPAKSISSALSNLQKGLVSGERLFELLDTKSKIEDKQDAKVLSDFKTSIQFKNISFSYGNDMVLKNIDLTVEKGKTIALVGKSGGGKSTLADLLPRFYDVTEGELLIDGYNVKDLTQESLRSHMGIVTQEAILFNDTIFNNIAFSKPNATQEEVVAAAKIANAHDFIVQSENGYETNIGERGSKLSGGQRQRISIARAVLKNPPIMILDEATSALDSESERLVQDALNNLMKNRTSIVIAHRLSTIQNADEIIVLHDGTIVERGTHQELMELNGTYKKLTVIQGVL